MKNEKRKISGLLIFVVILIICGAIIITRYLNGIIIVSKLQDLKTNMLIIQAETKKGLDRVCFQTANLDKNKEEDFNKINEIKKENLLGIPIMETKEEIQEEIKNLPEEIIIDDNCYYLDENILENMGIDNRYIKEYEHFIAKYDFSKATVEIITTKGYNGNYTLTQINQLSKGE